MGSFRATVLGLTHLAPVLICFGFPLLIGTDNIRKDRKSSLKYLYTSFNSSYREVVGLLDDEELDFYSSVPKTPIPKKEWNEEPGTFGWSEWIKSIKNRMDIDGEWFPRFAKLIRKHIPHSSGDAATVQMRLACISEGQCKTCSAELAYRGEDLLYYQLKTAAVWMSGSCLESNPNPAGSKAVEQEINDMTGSWQRKAMSTIADFLDKTSSNLIRFSEYEKANKYGVPHIYGIPSDSLLGPDRRNLSCLVTGFYPRSANISILWFKNNVPVDEGIWSVGVRPSSNHRYQMKTGLVTDSFTSDYRCEIHTPYMDRPWRVEWHQEHPRYQSVWVFVVLVLAGLVRTGLVLAGLDLAGLVRAGLVRAGLVRTGLDLAGLDRAGLVRAGPDLAGLDRAGLVRAGLDLAGLDLAGLDRAGLVRAGLVRAGLILAGLVFLVLDFALLVYAVLQLASLPPACQLENYAGPSFSSRSRHYPDHYRPHPQSVRNVPAQTCDVSPIYLASSYKQGFLNELLNNRFNGNINRQSNTQIQLCFIKKPFIQTLHNHMAPKTGCFANINMKMVSA